MRVVFPLPGGEVTTTFRPSRTERTMAGITASMGNAARVTGRGLVVGARFRTFHMGCVHEREPASFVRLFVRAETSLSPRMDGMAVFCENEPL